MKQQKKKKGRSVQDLLGIKTFTKYGLSTNKGELLFYLVSPTNISVLSHTNIEIKIRHLMMVLSALPDIEIVCTDSSECFDDNKAYLTERLEVEENAKVRKLIKKDIEFLDTVQVEMATARQFFFVARIKGQKDKQVFETANRIESKIAGEGFEVHRLKKPEIKRILALYFDASMRVRPCPTLTANSFTRERMMRMRNKPVLIFFCLLLSAAAVLSGAKIYSELKERQKEKKDFASVAEIAKLPITEAPAESVTDTETEPSAEPTEQSVAEHNIQALIAENADCIGWLSIDGTSISYPVMYTPSEPQKYLRRSFYGQYSQSGVPFLDGRCSTVGGNLIIYGHNMKNGTMFSDLKKYLNTDFLNAHRTVRLETAGGVFLFTVTEVLKTNTADPWYDRISCEGGRRLLLSTCYGSGKDGRLLIIAEE